jgi:hypothetical protein
MIADGASAPRPARLLKSSKGEQHSPTASFFRSVHALKTRSRGPLKVRSMTNSFDASEVLAAAAAADLFEAVILISRSLLPLAARSCLHDHFKTTVDHAFSVKGHRVRVRL